MIIESIIKREHGSTVVLDDKTYKFQPNEDGRHVAEVTEKAHIERLLSITEGFRPLKKSETVKVSGPVQVEQAPTVQPVEEGGQEESDGDEEAKTDQSLDELKTAFEAKFGRKPHHKWSAERIQKELEAE